MYSIVYVKCLSSYHCFQGAYNLAGYYTMQYSFIFNALKIMHMCVDNVDSKLKGIQTYSESAPICCRYKMYLKIL